MPRVIPQRTIQDPTVSEIMSITFTRQPNGPGAFVTVSSASYGLLDENDNVAAVGSVSNQLNGAQQSALATYINNHIIPAIITAEDL